MNINKENSGLDSTNSERRADMLSKQARKNLISDEQILQYFVKWKELYIGMTALKSVKTMERKQILENPRNRSNKPPQERTNNVLIRSAKNVRTEDLRHSTRRSAKKDAKEMGQR